METAATALTTRAFCWRVERRDGICLGFTSHDRSLELGGLVYRSAPGMAPSAISLRDGLDASALDVAGALTAGAITSEDLAAGRWDRACVSILLVDWEAPDAEPVTLASGELGEVSAKGDAFEAELKGTAALLERPVAEQTSPTCRAELGDRRCRVDMAGRTRIARLTAFPEEDRVVVAGSGDGRFACGRLRWLGGANSGLRSEIVADGPDGLRLREPPPFAAGPGDLVELTEGCDKSFAACTGRFDNGINFRGEPHLPGADLLTRYRGG